MISSYSPAAATSTPVTVTWLSGPLPMRPAICPPEQAPHPLIQAAPLKTPASASRVSSQPAGSTFTRTVARSTMSGSAGSSSTARYVARTGTSTGPAAASSGTVIVHAPSRVSPGSSRSASTAALSTVQPAGTRGSNVTSVTGSVPPTRSCAVTSSDPPAGTSVVSLGDAVTVTAGTAQVTWASAQSAWSKFMPSPPSVTTSRRNLAPDRLAVTYLAGSAPVISPLSATLVLSAQTWNTTDPASAPLWLTSSSTPTLLENDAHCPPT